MDYTELYQVLMSIQDMDTFQEFMKDLCTDKELEQMTQRIVVAKMLMEGATYEEVIDRTGISSATLSRVSRCIKHGKGYNSVL